eukprot:4941433-Pyramimonas_sp.AAC.1
MRSYTSEAAQNPNGPTVAPRGRKTTNVRKYLGNRRQRPTTSPPSSRPQPLTAPPLPLVGGRQLTSESACGTDGNVQNVSPPGRP